MKVVFLDFDGVINSEEWFWKRCPATERTLEEWERNAFDPGLVLRLNTLARRTGAKFVISSSWRIGRTVESLRELLNGLYGFKGEIIGKTPNLSRCDVPRYLPETEPVQRGEEIWVWLQEHPEVTAFAVLDDSGDMVPVQDHFVQTLWYDGLQDEHIDLVIKILDRESSNRQDIGL